MNWKDNRSFEGLNALGRCNMNKMPLLNNEIEEFCGEDTAAKFISYLKEDELVGDLLTLDYSEATVLVHDSLRKPVGGQ